MTKCNCTNAHGKRRQTSRQANFYTFDHDKQKLILTSEVRIVVTRKIALNV